MERRLSLTTWLLVTMVVLLGSYVYVVEVRGGAAKQARQEADAKLLPFSPDEATELVLSGPEGRIVCRKTRDRWRVTEPIAAAADEGSVTRLLEDLAEARVEQTAVEKPDDLAAFGLAQPRVIAVTAGSSGSKAPGSRPEPLGAGSREPGAAPQARIEVGATNPTGEFVYARRGRDGPVLLVRQRLGQTVAKSLYDLRDKTVLDLSPEEVTAITFRHRDRTVRLVRERPDGARGAPGSGREPESPRSREPAVAGWKLVEPLHARADRGAIDRMFNLISYVRAEEFVAEKPKDLAQYGLAPPLATARFEMTSGRSKSLLIGRQIEVGATRRAYARAPGSGPVFTINDNLPQDASRPPEAWRDRRVTDFVRADAAELRLISPARTVIAAKVEGENGAEWRLAEFAGSVAEGMDLAAAARLPTAMRADRDRVEDLLAKLSILEARSFLDGASPSEVRFGLARPEMKVVVLDREGQTIAELSLGKREREERYATGPHLGGVFRVPVGETERFHVAARDLSAR
jgi:hypothetical protein